MAENLPYIAQLVREQDPDRFLLSMLMPTGVQQDLLSIFAFNHEIAKTREVVSETQLGLIRLQWWRDAIGKIYESCEVLEHEVLEALAGAIERHSLSRAYFDELIYAREFDLEDVLPAHLDGLLSYCDFTTTPLLKLAMQVMGDDPDGEVVQPVAINYALCGLMRAVPFHAQGQRCYLPEDLVKAAGQSVNKLYEIKPHENLPGVVRECMGYFQDGLKPKNKFLKASNVLAGIYKNQITSMDYNVFNPKMGLDPPFKALRLLFSYKLF